MNGYVETTKFSFTMEWDELPEDFREQKIDAYLENMYPDFYDPDDDGANGPFPTLAQFQEEPDNRENAEQHIMVHFPIYF